MHLLSHPNKSLNSHLSDVAKVATSLVKSKDLNLVLNFESKKFDISEVIVDLVYLSAAFHDLGKATTFFQYYILHLDEVHDRRKSHALSSALFVFYTADIFLESKKINPDIRKLLAVFAFSAVKRHHGRLENLSSEVLISNDWQELLIEMVLSIDKLKIQEIIDDQISRYKLEIKWTNFVDYVVNKEYNEILEDFSFDYLQTNYSELDSDSKIAMYYIHQLIYSALLYADKNDVILDEKIIFQDQQEVMKKIHDYRELKGFNQPMNEINSIKNDAFFSSVAKLEKIFRKEQHLYSLTLPTGLGKTITAYNLADKLRNLSGLRNSKIVITIPFTSIIDQNFEVFSDILRTSNSDILLKHHHLAEPIYKTNENIIDYFQSKFLIETWQSDTIVSTFVQLLETLLSCDKAKLMKFSNLVNSVILLDEIQTIPYEYWETIRETFAVLGARFNIYFILISATQPLIFRPKEEITELIPDYKKYFRYFNRTRLIINGKITFAEFKIELIQYVNGHPKEDVLVILNTKNVARETFQFLCEEIEIENVETYFLSTLITPFERKAIISLIKKNTGKQKVIISTQLVEAGVDISVDTVFRQFAPLDSIIQAAGRANRYNEKKKISDVFIYDIEEYRRTSNMIYGSDLLIKTEIVLKNLREVEEQNYLQLIEMYYSEIRRQSDNTSQPILNAIKKLEFSLADFKLIKINETESAYIQLNKKAEKTWKKYIEICSREDLTSWEREAEFSLIKFDFYDFVINVPIPFNATQIDFDSEKRYNFYVSEYDNPSRNYHYSENNYSKNIGYVPSTETAFIL